MAILKKDRKKLHLNKFFLILLTFLKPLKVVLINMIKFLMMSVKLASPCPLNIKILWNKGYGIIISVRDVTNKTWSNFVEVWYEVIKVWWLYDFYERRYIRKFLREVTKLYKELNRKTNFLRGSLGSSSIIWNWF